MNTKILWVIINFIPFYLNSQSNRVKYINSIIEKSTSINNLNNDFNQLFSAILLNKDFDESVNDIIEIRSLPYLEIDDSLFCSIKCDYKSKEFLFTIKPKYTEIRELFFKTIKGRNYYFSYNVSDNKKSILRKKLYDGENIFWIGEFLDLNNKHLLLRVSRNICFFKEGELYTFENKKPIKFYEKYKRVLLHSFNFLDNKCVCK